MFYEILVKIFQFSITASIGILVGMFIREWIFRNDKDDEWLQK